MPFLVFGGGGGGGGEGVLSKLGGGKDGDGNVLELDG
jgi:hypothetical protein